MSGDEKKQQIQRSGDSAQRQPIFLLPTAVTVLCGLLIAIQAADSLVLNESGRSVLLNWFAFVPYRALHPEAFDGSWLPLLWTPITHAFLHGGWEHVILNTVWLAIFATPVTQRYGAGRMLVVFLAGAALGALAFALTTIGQLQVLVGASGGIAGLTGVAVRFIFQPPVVVVDPDTGERVAVGRHLATFSQFVRNPTARFFALTWIVLNGVVPLLPLLMGSDAIQIAWQSHLAGFLAGFFIAPLLERGHRD